MNHAQKLFSITKQPKEKTISALICVLIDACEMKVDELEKLGCNVEALEKNLHYLGIGIEENGEQKVLEHIKETLSPKIELYQEILSQLEN